MKSKFLVTTLTLALAIGGAAVLTPIPGAMAQHYVAPPYWVEDIGQGCSEFGPYGCGMPYPPVDSCYFSPHMVIVIPVDCPPGSPNYYPYTDSSFGEDRGQYSDQRYRDDSLQRFEGTGNRTELKEFQPDRRERFERRQPTTARPEIEPQSPFVQPAERPDLGKAVDRGVRGAAPDKNSDLKGGWEFDDHSHDDHAGHDHSAHDHSGHGHNGHDHGYSKGK